MKLCKSCEELQDKPAHVEPHDRLSCDSTMLRSDGDRERQRCRDCGTTWERFKSNQTYRGKPQFWTVLPELSTPPTIAQRL
jgi:hypothetical protein